MIQQIIYGKRMSGKSTYVCQRMLEEQDSIYICYNRETVQYFVKQFPNLKGRLVTLKQLTRRWRKNGYCKAPKFYLEWLDWINLKDNIRKKLLTKVYVIIFDQQEYQQEFREYSGVKFKKIQKNNGWI